MEELQKHANYVVNTFWADNDLLKKEELGRKFIMSVFEHIIAVERERCAKIAESKIGDARFPDFEGGYQTAAEDIATEIRKGGAT